MPKPTFESTPNPDALKCDVVVPAIPSDAIRSYDHARPPAAGDEGDPIAAALLEVPRVAGVFIGPAFVTIRRAPGAAWPAIKSAVTKVLRDHDLA